MNFEHMTVAVPMVGEMAVGAIFVIIISIAVFEMGGGRFVSAVA